MMIDRSEIGMITGREIETTTEDATRTTIGREIEPITGSETVTIDVGRIEMTPTVGVVSGRSICTITVNI